MKEIKLLIFTASILLMGLFTACESDNNKDYSTTFKFGTTNPVDSLFAGDSYVLKGSIISEGPLQTVQFYRSFPFNNKQDSVEMAATKITNINKDTCNFSISVPTVNDQTYIWVKATEASGHVNSIKYTLNMRTSNIITYKNIPMGGWMSNYGSACDLDTGTPYGSSGLGNPNIAAIVDIFFDGGELGSVDLDATVFYPEDYSGARFPDTGTRFAATNIAASDFDDIQADDNFKNLTGTLSIIPIHVGDVIFFQDKSGRKGLLRIESMSDPEGDLVITEKIQK